MWEAVCKQIVAAGTAGWLATIACADPTPWNISVMGISLAVLVASIAGSAMRRMRQPPEPDTQIARRVLLTVIDGFYAGWVAMAMVAIPLAWFGGGDRPLGDLVRPEVVAALCAIFIVPFLRRKAGAYTDRIFDALLVAVVDLLKGWLGRKGSGG